MVENLLASLQCGFTVLTTPAVIMDRKKQIENTQQGDSRWLRLTSNAEVQSLILVGALRSHMPHSVTKQKLGEKTTGGKIWDSFSRDITHMSK